MSVAYEQKTMQIRVNHIPEEGLRHHVTCDPSAMDMERPDIHLDQPFEVDAMITKVDDELVVQADIRCSLRLSCAKCLEEFHATIQTGTVLSYTVRPSDVVDITDDVRQEIILAYPMIPICAPGCKGLCPACGWNLNQGSCAHHSQGKESSHGATEE